MYIASASTKVYVFLDILESADLVCSMHVLFFFELHNTSETLTTHAHLSL
jgi:hypothetical protein